MQHRSSKSYKITSNKRERTKNDQIELNNDEEAKDN